MATGHPRGIFNQDPEFITYGTGTRKAADELAKFRASLRASGDIVGGEPRLVSDQTPSGFPASKYGVGDAFNQTLRDEDWNNAYLEGRKLGLSDRDAKMVARMRIGQSATQDVEGRPGIRQAINETEMTDLRRALTAQAAESLDPYIGPNYQEQKVATEPIDPYWYTAEGKEELLDYAADKAYSDTDLARAARKRERFYDLQGVDYDYRDKIEEWKDAWKQGHTIDPDTPKAVPIKAGSITRSGETFDVPVETPSIKKAIQQSQSTPIPPRSAIVLRDKLEARHIPRMPSGRRGAGRFPIELLLAAIASGAGGVVAADAINQPNQELVEVM